MEETVLTAATELSPATVATGGVDDFAAVATVMVVETLRAEPSVGATGSNVLAARTAIQRTET